MRIGKFQKNKEFFKLNVIIRIKMLSMYTVLISIKIFISMLYLANFLKQTI